MTTSFRPVAGATVALVLLLAVPFASAQQVDLRVTVDSVTVGDRFQLSVTARHDFAAPARFPIADTSTVLQFGDVEVISHRLFEDTRAEGPRIDSIVYEVTTFALDTAHVASIPVLFTAGEDTFTVRTEARVIPVTPLVPDDAEGIKDVAPLVDFPSATWPFAAAAVLLVAAALLAFYLYRKRKGGTTSALPQAPPVPADREAFERLDALERLDLTDPANIPPYYDELSALLRTYVARRLHVRALESTTGELIHELRRHGTPSEETTARLRNVLVAADYVKFANASPPPSKALRLTSVARDIVEDVERDLRPAPVTDQADPNGSDHTSGLQPPRSEFAPVDDAPRPSPDYPERPDASSLQ
ncbi:MAG: hypothetical protein WD021_11320 [Rhodothermales bacterium]